MSTDAAPRRLATALAVALAAGLALSVSPSAAGWTQASVQSAAPPSVTTYTVPAPVMSCGTIVAGVSFSWTPVPGATGYRFYWANGTKSDTVGAGTTSYVVVPLLAHNSAWVVALRSFGSTTWASVESNHQDYWAVVVAACG